ALSLSPLSLSLSSSRCLSPLSELLGIAPPRLCLSSTSPLCPFRVSPSSRSSSSSSSPLLLMLHLYGVGFFSLSPSPSTCFLLSHLLFGERCSRRSVC